MFGYKGWAEVVRRQVRWLTAVGSTELESHPMFQPFILPQILSDGSRLQEKEAHLMGKPLLPPWLKDSKPSLSQLFPIFPQGSVISLGY